MCEKGIGVPDSDESARHERIPAEEMTEDAGNIEGLQTSTKSGKHSSVEKLAASRPEFNASPGANPVAGAFGSLRCEVCGKRFDSPEELIAHEIDSHPEL